MGRHAHIHTHLGHSIKYASYLIWPKQPESHKNKKFAEVTQGRIHEGNSIQDDTI